MKTLLVLFAVCLFEGTCLGAKGPPQFDVDYGTGLGVGRCFTAKCEVFRGVFLTGAPKAGEPVRVQVTEWLFGHDPSSGLEIVNIKFEPPSKTSSNDGSPLYLVWDGINVSPNVPVTVVLTLEHTGFRQAGEPLLITVDERRAALIASLATEASQLKRSPQYVSALVARISEGTNPSLGGFLFMALAYTRLVPDADTRCDLMFQLIQSTSVPPADLATVALMMSTRYTEESPAGRAATIDRMSRLGTDKDSWTAAAGILGLSHIAQTEQSLTKLIPSSARGKLLENYRELVRTKKVRPDMMFELALGLPANNDVVQK